MLIVMQANATEEQVRAVCARIEALGFKAHPIPGSTRTAIGITGNTGSVDIGSLESMPGVVERSEEHTSELQSRGHLVCRLLLEKKKYNNRRTSFKIYLDIKRRIIVYYE